LISRISVSFLSQLLRRDLLHKATNCNVCLYSHFFLHRLILQPSALNLIHSFSILSDDRSNASSKTVPPHSAI
jgi:hypothetical protein